MNAVKACAAAVRFSAVKRTPYCLCVVRTMSWMAALALANAATAQNRMPGMEMPTAPESAPDAIEQPTTTIPSEKARLPNSAAKVDDLAAPMKMPMRPMQGGQAPADARDPNAYADGYEYTTMPGMEMTDQIVYGMVQLEEFEYLSSNEGDGYAWSVQANRGNDSNKLWLRMQGLKIANELDPTTSGEVLWWRPYSAFWGTQLGIRQDFGAGSHTYLAAGVEGIAPNWFKVEATAYLGDDARLSARLKGSYELRFTNRLILVPSLEANVYSKAEDERGLGAGLGNIEGGLRLRYELHRKFAPYLGYVWERSFAGTADRRPAGDSVNEHRFVAGIKLWW